MANKIQGDVLDAKAVEAAVSEAAQKTPLQEKTKITDFKCETLLNSWYKHKLHNLHYGTVL